jgi:hypothetical protein
MHMNKTQSFNLAFMRGNAFGVVTITTLALVAIALALPHVTHAQSVFGYGGGGRLPLPIPPSVSRLLFNLPTFLNNLFSHVFGSGFRF